MILWLVATAAAAVADCEHLLKSVAMNLLLLWCRFRGNFSKTENKTMANPSIFELSFKFLALPFARNRVFSLALFWKANSGCCFVVIVTAECCLHSLICFVRRKLCSINNIYEAFSKSYWEIWISPIPKILFCAKSCTLAHAHTHFRAFILLPLTYSKALPLLWFQKC